jgi:hypothetical protein
MSPPNSLRLLHAQCLWNAELLGIFLAEGLSQPL